MSDDMQQVRADISDIKAATRSLQDMHYRTMTAVAQMTGDIADIKRDMSTKMATKDDIGRLTGQIAGLAAKVDERLDWAKHEVRSDEYEKRLSRLEDGRA